MEDSRLTVCFLVLLKKPKTKCRKIRPWLDLEFLSIVGLRGRLLKLLNHILILFFVIEFFFFVAILLSSCIKIYKIS